MIDTCFKPRKVMPVVKFITALLSDVGDYMSYLAMTANFLIFAYKLLITRNSVASHPAFLQRKIRYIFSLLPPGSLPDLHD